LRCNPQQPRNNRSSIARHSKAEREEEDGEEEEGIRIKASRRGCKGDARGRFVERPAGESRGRKRKGDKERTDIERSERIKLAALAPAPALTGGSPRFE